MKSKTFRGVKVFTVVFAVVATVIAPLQAPRAYAAVSFFLDDFGTGSSVNDIPGWDEEGSDSSATTRAQASGSGNDSASPDGGRFAKIHDNEWICRVIDASGYTDLELAYYWRGDSDSFQSIDDGIVEYKAGAGSCSYSGWTELKNHDLRVDSSWSTQSSFALPDEIDDGSFRLRFRTDAFDFNGDEYFRVDGVTLTGEPVEEEVAGPVVARKFEDENGNGQFDDNENGLEEWWMALGVMGQPEQQACEGECPEEDTIPIEIIAMQLTGDGGFVNFEIPEEYEGDLVLLEEDRARWTQTSPRFQVDSFFDITYRIDVDDPPQWNVDSFFDIFVEVESGPLDQGDIPNGESDLQELLFGNRESRGRSNRPQYGTLVLEKVVRGGSLSYGDFFYEIDGGSFNSSGRFDDSGRNSFSNVPVGGYTVLEIEADGYTVTFEGDCSEAGVISVTAGNTSTCRVINTHDTWQEGDDSEDPSAPDEESQGQEGVGGATPNTGTLLIEKVIIGGPASYGDFSFTLDGEPDDFWPAGVNSYEVAPGLHGVIEVPSDGYAPSYGGDCNVFGFIAVGSGEIRTCTITNTYAVGGFNPEGEPEPQASGDHLIVSNIGSSGDDGVRQDPLDNPGAMEDEMTDGTDDRPASGSDGTAAIAGSLSGLAPCGAGGVGWLGANIFLLVVVLYFWKDRRGSHWLATILLVVVALFMNSWANSCGLHMAWLPALLSLVTWLLMKLLGRADSE